LLDRSQKLRVEGFLLQAQEFVTTGIADAHSLPPCQWLSSASISGVPFGKMVGATDRLRSVAPPGLGIYLYSLPVVTLRSTTG